MDCSANGLLSGLELELHTHGVNGLGDHLQHLGSLQSLQSERFRLAFNHDRSALVSAVALRTLIAKENNDQVFLRPLFTVSVSS